MDNTLTGVIIGALASWVPICISTIASIIENRAARKHELRKLDIEIYHREKINALKQYNRALSAILEDGRSYDRMIEYNAAHDTLIMMVSDDSYTTMQNVHKHVSQMHKQYAHSLSDSPIPIYLYDLHEPLLLCLRKEMDTLHRSSGLDCSSAFEICPPPSESAEPVLDQEAQPPAAN